VATRLKPFFTFFGGKHKLAPRYPAPTRRLLIEPFASSAGYATFHHTLDVRLYNLDPIICGVWDYLINCSSREVRRLPVKFDHVDELNAPQEAKWLIGFWLNRASTGPRLSPSAWMRTELHPTCFWGAVVKERIAHQCQFIRHWTIKNIPYSRVPCKRATWFIDPPYDHASGRLYRHKVMNHDRLGTWCRSLPGQLIVCEREGADWLPFSPFQIARALEGSRGKSVSKEMMWTRDNQLHISVRVTHGA
jgi:hypothetical protein